MYIKRGKPRTALVVEHTFLLCKPDAQLYHRQILQILSDAGFQIVAKSFIITPELAKIITSTFQSVRRRMCAERGSDTLFNGGKSLTSNDLLISEKRQGEVSMTYINKTEDTEDEDDGDGDYYCAGKISEYDKKNKNNDNKKKNNYNEKIMDSHCEKVEAHQRIMAEIINLARRHEAVEDGVNAGLPNAGSKDSETEVQQQQQQQQRQEQEEGATTIVTEEKDGKNGDMHSHSVKHERRVAAAELKNTMIEAMSYKNLLKAHVRHLAFGGTCLAVELSGQNAVERLLEIVGPENPIIARRVAPNSIRARFGKDLIHNAVHAASNLTEASQCISAVFGFTTHYSAADIRTHCTMSVSDGIKNNTHVERNLPIIIRPSCELVYLPHRKPLTLTSAFYVKKTNPQAHISYYTGELYTDGKKTTTTDEGEGLKTGQENIIENNSLQQKVEELEGKLLQERTELMTHAKLIRMRELDLLLREHAMEKATCGLNISSRPVEKKLRYRNFSVGSSILTDEHITQRRMSLLTTEEKQSFAFQEFTKEILSPSQEQQKGLSNPILTEVKKTPFVTTTYVHKEMGPIINPEDISLLLSRPVRLRALYVALQHFSQNGEVMQEDIIALYNRSPTIQLSWIDNHYDYFQCYVKQNTEEPVSFDNFVLVLMFLFKQ